MYSIDYFILSQLQIIKAIYELPESITPFVYRVIELSTNVNEPSTVYLLEEGLELWLVVLQYTPTINEALLKLCDNLMPIIGELIINLWFLTVKRGEIRTAIS